MKKKFLSLIAFIFVVTGLCTTPVYAKEITKAHVTFEWGLGLRTSPGVKDDNLIGYLTYDSELVIIGYSDKGDGCDDRWVEITHDANNKTYHGYVCESFIKIDEPVEVTKETKEEVKEEIKEEPKEEVKEEIKEETKEEPKEEKSDMAKMTDEEFDAYLNNQGFPESYKSKLKTIHKQHPNWIFVADKSKFTWQQALNEELKPGENLFNVNLTTVKYGYEGYLSTREGDYDWETELFIPHDGDFWFQANDRTIAYYLDPRNFLDEKNLFMFEDLTYHPEYQTLDSVNKILSSDFLKQFSGYFIEAAQLYNVSPTYLASLSRQEVGTSTENICTNGKAGVLADGVDYTGYYNFFNHGASSSPNPKLKSLQTAVKYKWNNQRDSIVEGSYLIWHNYIAAGQYTSYLHKFNVSKTAREGIWHQYTTNIQALTGPSVTTYNSYYNIGKIDSAFVFYIPVYDGMPESTTLPPLGNPNNRLKELKVNNSLVTNFSGSTYSYIVNVPANSESVNISGVTMSSKATTNGFGTIKLTGDVTVAKVIVTAQNGDVNTYTITINREKAAVVVEEPKEEKQEESKNTQEVIPETKKEETITEKVPEKKPEKVVEISLDDVMKSSTYKYNDNYLWNLTLGTDVNKVIANLTKNYPTTSINIKDKNGVAKNTGTIVTGDKVIISNNGKERTYTVVIYGDVSGDGIINLSDLLGVQKHILKQSTLLNAYSKAADVNKDGTITLADILTIQKQILKVSNISQG